MAVDTHAFSSSMISEGSFDEESGDMELTFVKGGSYSFSGVPADLWESLKSSVSPGGFYHQNIKGKYGA